MSGKRYILGYMILWTIVNTSASNHILEPLLVDISSNNLNKMSQLVGSLYAQSNFSTLAIFRPKSVACLVTESLKLHDLQLHPWFLLTVQEDIVPISTHYSSAVMAMVCLCKKINRRLLRTLTKSLHHIRGTRILFVLKDIPLYARLELLSKLFQYCNKVQMLNVVAVFEEDFTQIAENQSWWYSYTRFPIFRVEFLTGSIYFPHRLSDIHGYAIRSLPSQVEPHSIVFYDNQNQLQFSGYLYHLVYNFVKKINGTLKYVLPVEPSEYNYLHIIENMTLEKQLDIPIYIAMLYGLEPYQIYTSSDVLEIWHWVIMLPEPGFYEKYENFTIFFITMRLLLVITLMCSLLYSFLFTIINNQLTKRKSKIVDVSTVIMEIFFNDRVIRGLIGTPFILPKLFNWRLRLVCGLLFLQGLITSNVFAAFINSFFSTPTYRPRIHTFEDLLKSGLKVVIDATGYKVIEMMVTKEFIRKYSHIFKPIANIGEFFQMRKTFNTDYAYKIDSSSWMVYEQQQQHFSRNLFYLSEKLNFSPFIPMAVPLPENSVFRETFNAYMHQMRCTGMWQHWIRKSASELVQARQLNSTDLSLEYQHSKLSFEDLHYVWIGILSSQTIAALIFLLEIIYFKCIQRKRNRFLSIQ